MVAFGTVRSSLDNSVSLVDTAEQITVICRDFSSNNNVDVCADIEETLCVDS